ncbi:hypothetical protein BD413DRAFT_200065 [Trametes elegans]|nr:hypothetical protein BD413DRAFT_200065 [Trametes elegans]
MSSRTQGTVSEQGVLANPQPDSLISTSDFDPFHLSNALDEPEDVYEEGGDENVPPPGPSRQVYPLPGVATSDIRRHIDDSFDTLFDRPTRRAALALFEGDNNAPWPTLFLESEGENAVPPHTHSTAPSPLESSENIVRPFGDYHGPLGELPLRYFVGDVKREDAEQADQDVDEMELPPLFISPGLREISDDDDSTSF